MKFLNTLIASIILSVSCFVNTASAGLIVQDLGSGITKVTVDPINFTVTQSGSAGFLIFENFWAVTSTTCGLAISSTMTYKINSSTAVTPTQFSCTGRYNSTYHGFDNNDLAFDFNGGLSLINAVIGDQISFGGSFVFSTNSQGIASTTGPWKAHLSGAGGSIAFTQIASPVPEPSTFAIFALGMIGLASRRFKKQA